MAIALVGTPVVGNDPAAGTTLASPAKNTTTGNSLLVGCLSQQGDFVGTTITGVTDTAGNTYTPLTMQGSAGAGAQILRWFYCHNITGNASNVATGTWSASTATRHIIQIEFSGAKNQAPISEGGNATLGVSSCPVNIAMGSAVGAIFSMATSSNDRTWTPGTGFTEINDWGSSAGADYYTGFNATGTITADMVPTSATNISLVAVGFEEAPVGPTITVQPADQTVNSGASANFSVTATGGTAPLSYQWKKNGSNVGTNSSSYSLTAAYADQGAQITVVVTDAAAISATSSAATLRIAFNLAGTGPRSETSLGNGAFGAGSFETYITGTAAAGGTHATTGALASQDATLAGTAAHFTLHPTSGVLASQTATIAGTATHLTLHTTTGALSAQAATIAGSAAHENATTGALSAQAATIAGTATHFTLHTSSGTLSSQAATISGAAAHEHASTGALSAQDATIAGAADHTVAGVSHSTSGALAAQDATVSGSATHLTLHTTTGALAAQSATVSGSAAHQHAATGTLAAQDATVAGTAAHLTLHTSTGALTSQAATLAGSAAHEHAASGALASQGATISGAAAHTSVGTHDATGALQAQDAQISGSAEHVSNAPDVTGGWGTYLPRRKKKKPEPEEVEESPAIVPEEVQEPEPAMAVALRKAKISAEKFADQAIEQAAKAYARGVVAQQALAAQIESDRLIADMRRRRDDEELALLFILTARKRKPRQPA